MDALLTINTIRANSSELYQSRIPEATEANMKDIGIMLTSQDYEAQKNEFSPALVKKVAFVDAINRLYKNELAVLKKGTRPYGGFKEMAHVNPVKGKNFKSQDVSSLLTVAKPDIKTAYFTRNRQDMYEVSISDAELRTAFTSPAEFSKLYEKIINALYSGDNMDEYLLMRDGISECVTGGKIRSVEVDYAANSENLVRAANKMSRYFKYESDQYAGYNLINSEAIEAGTETPVITRCPVDRQVLIVREDVDVDTNFDVLAKAFHNSKVDFETRKICVDTFADPDILAVLADESFFEFEDQEYKVKDFENGSNLTTKYMLHHWETIQFNPLANAIAFKQKTNA